MAACMSHLLTHRISSCSRRRPPSARDGGSHVRTCRGRLRRRRERQKGHDRPPPHPPPTAAAFPGGLRGEAAALEKVAFPLVQLEEVVTHSSPDGLNLGENSPPARGNRRPGGFSPTADVWSLAEEFEEMFQNIPGLESEFAERVTFMAVWGFFFCCFLPVCDRLRPQTRSRLALDVGRGDTIPTCLSGRSNPSNCLLVSINSQEV